MEFCSTFSSSGCFESFETLTVRSAQSLPANTPTKEPIKAPRITLPAQESNDQTAHRSESAMRAIEPVVG